MTTPATTEPISEVGDLLPPPADAEHEQGEWQHEQHLLGIGDDETSSAAAPKPIATRRGTDKRDEQEEAERQAAGRHVMPGARSNNVPLTSSAHPARAISNGGEQQLTAEQTSR